MCEDVAVLLMHQSIKTGQAFGLQALLRADFISSHSLEFIKKAAGKQKQTKTMVQQLHGSYVQLLLR